MGGGMDEVSGASRDGVGLRCGSYQLLHDDMPERLWNLPTSQLSQVEAPMPEYFPLSHEVQAAEPALENVPLTHAAHVLEPATE